MSKTDFTKYFLKNKKDLTGKSNKYETSKMSF